jgi:hypothetical protein
MKHALKPRSLTRPLMGLFVTKKGVNPHILYPESYYRRVYFDKQMFDGIELVAKKDYPKHLWLEKEIKTVANVTRRDAEEFLALAGQMQIEPEIQSFTLEEANVALVELKSGKIRGSKVLRIAVQ